MLFEVIDPSGKGVMCTNYVSCIPNANQLSSMTSAGYKFKIDGKNITKKKLLEYVDENSKSFQ